MSGMQRPAHCLSPLLLVDSATFLTILFSVTLNWAPGTQAVYFVENPYESVVTHFSVGQNVIKVQRLFNMTDSEPIPQMTIQNILINAVYEFSDVIRFHIDGDGWINITHLNRAQARDITNVSLYVTSNDQHHEIVAYTIVNIRKVNVSGETRECPYQQPAYHQHLCFGDDDGNDKELVLTVEENQSGITLSRLRQGVFLRSICRKASVNYQIANGTNLRNGMHIADFFEVQQNTSFLYLKSPLNREDTAELHLTVLCTVHLPTQKVSKFKRNIRVIVGDVDDNPPLFQTLQHFQRTINPAETIKSLSAVVTDRDMATADEYEVTARNDPLGIVKNITKREFHHGQLVDQKPVANSPTATSIAAVIALNWSTSALANYTFYSVDILFKDKNYIRGIESNIEGTAIYTLHVKGHDLNIQKTISRNASKYAQIYKIPDKGGDHFYIDPRETTIFAVSWYTGIVYVDSELALRSTSHKVIKFKVKIMKGNVVQEKVHITVNIDDTPVNVTGECGYSCSFYKSKEECTSHCGLGTISGHCHVRKGLKHSPTALYGTCSPNLVHCPDGICDDVESNHPMLCPQDCTLKNVNGGSLNTKYKPPKGIKQAGGWCSCDTSGSCTCKTPPPPSPPSPPKKKPITEASMECNCDRDVKIYPRQSTFATPSLNDTNNKPINRDENFVPKNRNDDGCSGNCKTIVIAVVSGFLCFTYAIILIYCMWRCHRHRRHNNKTNKKYPPGSVSMSAVHSDYVEEQNRLVSQSNMADLAAPKSIDGHSEVSQFHAL